jgi:hypothetical protein
VSGTLRRFTALADTHRVLRHGGRIIAIEAGPKSGLAGVLSPHRPDPAYEAAGAAPAHVQGLCSRRLHG